jgi:hypothetical protein
MSAEDVIHQILKQHTREQDFKAAASRANKEEVWLISIWPLLCFKYSSFEK